MGKWEDCQFWLMYPAQSLGHESILRRGNKGIKISQDIKGEELSRDQDIELHDWRDFTTVKPERSALAEFVEQMARRMTTVSTLLKQSSGGVLTPTQRLVNEFLQASIECDSNPPELRALATELPKVKRHVVDGQVFKLVGSLKPLPTEEIIGRLDSSNLPFDKFWLETSTGLPSIGIGRLGYMVTANPNTKGVSFQVVAEQLGSHDAGETWSPFGKDRRGILSHGVTIQVSPYDGIQFDEDKFVQLLERVDRAQKSAFSADILESKTDYSKKIDAIYGVTDVISRILVVLGSDRVPNDFFRTRTKEEMARDAAEDKKQMDWNKARQKKGQPLILPVTPIKIDLTRIDPGFSEVHTAKQARLLLGWTSVRRSKDIVSKYGKVYNRKPHDRRIPAAVDRRDAVREITARDGFGVVIEAGRPQIRQVPGSGNENRPG